MEVKARAKDKDNAVAAKAVRVETTMATVPTMVADVVSMTDAATISATIVAVKITVAEINTSPRRVKKSTIRRRKLSFVVT